MNDNRISKLKQILATGDNDPFIRYALALEYQNENPEEALLLFEDLLHSNEEYEPTYYPAALLLASLGHVKRADEVFSKGINRLKSTGNLKALAELNNAYQNFLLEL